MDITLSRKSIQNTVAAIALVLIVAAGGYYAWTNGLLDRFFVQHSASAAPAIDAPAVSALIDMYTPDRSGERTAWEDKVCANMTGDGCLVFRKMYAPAIWNAAQQGEIVVSTSEVVDMLSNGSQVWKVNLTLGGEADAIFIYVEQGRAGQWLLARVLFDEEAKQYQ